MANYTLTRCHSITLVVFHSLIVLISYLFDSLARIFLFLGFPHSPFLNAKIADFLFCETKNFWDD